MKIIDSDNLKKIQLEILDIVVAYCKKNDIRYFLYAGTLIGAVRHKGYIPWDDDIDIALFRDDYEKFIKEFNNYRMLYKVNSSSNTKGYPYPYAKVSFENSVLKVENDNDTVRLGVNIDIFPIDTAPQDKRQQRKLVKRIHRQIIILEMKARVISKQTSFFKNLFIFVIKYLFKYFTTEKVVSKIIKLATKYRGKQSDQVGVLVWQYGNCEIVDKAIFDAVDSKEFEGRFLDAPIGYHQWLVAKYGNYMDLPPIEIQKSHHKFVAYWKENCSK